jgi:hypothetical protein
VLPEAGSSFPFERKQQGIRLKAAGQQVAGGVGTVSASQ